jgi:hypothetical protein
MPVQTRHAVAGLAVVFMGAVVVGGSGVLSGGHHDASAGIIATPTGNEAAATATPTATAKPSRFTATASRDDSGRITISGVAGGSASGNKLVVQRKQGGTWTDFPAGTTAGKGGAYSVWLNTSRSGNNVFRVKDEKTGATSDPVTVKV